MINKDSFIQEHNNIISQYFNSLSSNEINFDEKDFGFLINIINDPIKHDRKKIDLSKCLIFSKKIIFNNKECNVVKINSNNNLSFFHELNFIYENRNMSFFSSVGKISSFPNFSIIDNENFNINVEYGNEERALLTIKNKKDTLNRVIREYINSNSENNYTDLSLEEDKNHFHVRYEESGNVKMRITFREEVGTKIFNLMFENKKDNENQYSFILSVDNKNSILKFSENTFSLRVSNSKLPLLYLFKNSIFLQDDFKNTELSKENVDLINLSEDINLYESSEYIMFNLLLNNKKKIKDLIDSFKATNINNQSDVIMDFNKAREFLLDFTSQKKEKKIKLNPLDI